MSILAALIGDALLGFGFLSLVNQIRLVNSNLAAVIAVCGYISVVEGFFAHAALCIQPIIYKKIMETNNFKLADDTLEAYYKAVKPPFLIGYGFMIAGNYTLLYDRRRRKSAAPLSGDYGKIPRIL